MIGRPASDHQFGQPDVLRGLGFGLLFAALLWLALILVAWQLWHWLT